MVQEIEIEVKSMLTEHTFNKLLEGFNLTIDEAVHQQNHYFETPTFSLKAAQAGLRIRELQSTYTLTLKQPNKVGKLETHQPITAQQWEEAKNSNKLPIGDVVNQLLTLDIAVDELQFVDTLSTKRIEIPYNNGLLCFDESHYFDQIDYEIEFEGKSEEHANSTLETLLSTYNIQHNPAENKVRRFFRRKKELSEN